MLIVLLRLVHIVLGIFWVGTIIFTTFFLAPALQETGPEGGKVMQALQRRRFMTIMPIVALLTIVSGAWLMVRLYGTQVGLMATGMGKSLVAGAVAAILALIVGIAVARPAMMRAAAATDPAQAKRYRARSAAAGSVVTLLLIFAAAAMAVARYI